MVAGVISLLGAPINARVNKLDTTTDHPSNSTRKPNHTPEKKWQNTK
jgi:hypothetical protein